MNSRLGLISAVLSVCLTAPAALGDSGARFEAFTRARHALRLGFTVGGKVASIPIKAGDRVKADDVLIKLRDDEEKALVALQRMRATNELAIDQAKASHDQAKVEEKRMRQMREDNVVSPLELERAIVQTEIARLNVMAAEMELEMAQLELQRIEAAYKRMTLRAPLDGHIEEIAVAEGETVEALTPVLGLVVIDPVWIDVAVSAEQTLPLKIDDPAWVTMNLAGHKQVAKGKIIHMGQVADAASQTRLVRIELPNPDALPAGIEVAITFTAPQELALGSIEPQQID